MTAVGYEEPLRLSAAQAVIVRHYDVFQFIYVEFFLGGNGDVLFNAEAAENFNDVLFVRVLSLIALGENGCDPVAADILRDLS